MKAPMLLFVTDNACWGYKGFLDWVFWNTAEWIDVYLDQGAHAEITVWPMAGVRQFENPS